MRKARIMASSEWEDDASKCSYNPPDQRPTTNDQRPTTNDQRLPTPVDPLIRDISDTARWVAVYRARETDRPDAAFRDPFARKLAGERGEQIANSLPGFAEAEWSFMARTYLVDKYITSGVKNGSVDQVINLAAGLD